MLIEKKFFFSSASFWCSSTFLGIFRMLSSGGQIFSDLGTKMSRSGVLVFIIPSYMWYSQCPWLLVESKRWISCRNEQNLGTVFSSLKLARLPWPSFPWPTVVIQSFSSVMVNSTQEEHEGMRSMGQKSIQAHKSVEYSLIWKSTYNIFVLFLNLL